jgi:hypothetical protein
MTFFLSFLCPVSFPRTDPSQTSNNLFCPIFSATKDPSFFSLAENIAVS